jgi:myo-inositol-1(or 4)-monophosphatase
VALDLCKIADGTFDCLLHTGASRYLDIAAGIYILEKAGGVVSDFQGNENIREQTELTARSIFAAANRDIHEFILSSARNTGSGRE